MPMRARRQVVEGVTELNTELMRRTRSSRSATPARSETDAQPRVTAVIPALNEAENLPHVLPRIGGLVDEVVLVDGQSTDATQDVAFALRPDVRLITQQGRGKGDALRAGFEEATGDIIVMLDADGSTDPAEIPSFVGALLAGADFVKGSRFIQGAGTDDMPMFRRIGNRALSLLVRILYRCRCSDITYGFNACWARVLPQLRLDGDGFEIEGMMNLRALTAGLRVVEVASHEAPRRHGEGRLRTIPDGWLYLKIIIRERFRQRPRIEASWATEAR